MPNVPDHPTSLPKGPLRTCLERVQAEIVSEMNTAQHPSADGHCAHISPDQLQHWVHRLTEAIHFNGQVPDAISGLDTELPVFSDIDNAMRHMTYISTATDLAKAATHAKLAFESLGQARHRLSTNLARVADKLERFSDRIILTLDVEGAQKSVSEAYDLVTHDIMGVR